MPSRIVVIINASAGAGCQAAWTDNLTEKFRSSGLDVNILLAQNGAELIEMAQRAVAEKPQAIVAGGGDGTLNAVAAALVGTDIAFGVLPLGTLNHFAKDLHIPLDLEMATQNIIAGHITQVDVGEVNERIVRDRELGQKQWGLGKWPAFVWATLTTLRLYPFLRLRLSLNGEEQEHRTPCVFIGNNEYLMEGFNIGERQCLNAGQLSLYVVQRTGRLGLLRLALRALFGRLRQAKDFEALTAKEILIDTRHKHLRVATDGEITVMNTPLRYRVRPGALRVIVPENHETNGG
jgi:diacylglycerol kinase family enzyme